jgi:hypothetical protein
LTFNKKTITAGIPVMAFETAENLPAAGHEM